MSPPPNGPRTDLTEDRAIFFCSLGLIRWRGSSSRTTATQRCCEKNVSAVHWSWLSKPVCYQELQSNLWLLWEVHGSSSSGVDTGRPPSVLRRNTSLFQASLSRRQWSVARSQRRSLYVFGKLSTYPSPKPACCPEWEASVNIGLGEG